MAPSDPNAEPLPDPTVDMRHVSSVPDHIWVWWCCVKCHRERHTVHWWATFVREGCSHEDGWHEPTNNNPKGFTHEGIHGTFASRSRDMGLSEAVPEPKKIEMEEDVWA